MLKKRIKKIVIAEIILLVMMLIKPEISLAGARNGLSLWAYTVLPGIFPAAYLANLILNSIDISKRYIKYYVILCGIFIGFPGAAVLYAQYKEMYDGDDSLDGVLAYCNISSPSFVCSFIYGFDLIRDISLIKIIFIIYISSAAGIAGNLLFNQCLNKKHTFVNTDTEKNFRKNIMDNGKNMEIICINMIKSGGYIVFFACTAQYIIQFLPDTFVYRGVIIGITEITTGIARICADFENADIFNAAYARLIVLLINAFGGISTLLQTMAVAGRYLNIKKYIYNKLIYCVITTLVYMSVIYVI